MADAIGCDVLVVGGGIAGVSVAAVLAADHKVVLAEAESELAVHSTGRSAAAYLPSYGGELVRELTRASRPYFDELSEQLGRSLLTPRPVLWLSLDDAGERELDALSQALPSMNRLGPDESVGYCSILNPARIRGGALDDTAADIDVAGLHAAYLARLRGHGGTVLRSAPLTQATRTATGWRLRCGGHEVTCDVLVNAAGAWADEVAALCDITPAGLVPCRRTAAIAPLPPEAPAAHDWPLVSEITEQFYFRPESGQNLFVSPADETPVEPGSPKPDELALAAALDALNDTITLPLRRISHSWAGLRTFAADRNPVVGPAVDDPAFVWAAGQGGYGIQMGPALAVLVASKLGVRCERT